MKQIQAIQITIPEPCMQSWADMQRTIGGRHCAHCRKTVVDFTGMSDDALLNYIQWNGSGCGRMLKAQLDRVISLPEAPPRRRWPKMLLGLSLVLGIGKDTYGQHHNSPKTEEVPPVDIYMPVEVNFPRVNNESFEPDKKSYKSSLHISGILRDQKEEPVINAVVSLFDSDKSLGQTLTDFDGKYSFENLDSGLCGLPLLITFEYLDKSVSQNVYATYQRDLLNTSCLEIDYSRFTTGIMVIGRKPWHYHFLQRQWYKLRRAFHLI
jgi:hypothetical protein